MTVFHGALRGGAGFIAALQLLGCSAQPIAVIPLRHADASIGAPATTPMYLIKNGINASNTSAIAPQARKRAEAFCKARGEVPQEEQVTQQWPPIRDLVFSCVARTAKYKG